MSLWNNDPSWKQRAEQLEQLAFVDESEAYTVDQTGVYFDPKTKDFVILSASGCSCWEGDFNEEHFATLADALTDLATNTTDKYRPGTLVCEDLTKQALDAWAVRK